MSETVTKLRSAPSSKESEMMVLGCMLTSVNALNIAADSLDDSDFYFTEHKIIFQVLKSAYKNDKPVDLHLICEELKRQDKLKAIGGAAYLTTLAQYAGTSAHIEEYCSIVRDKSMLRSMINAAQVIEKKALEEPEDVLITLDEAQQLFYQISQAAHPTNGKLLSDILSGLKSESEQPYLKELQERQEAFAQRGPEDPGITGIPTHFIDLDKMINGLGKSNLIILAARPAMGKTAFAINIAENVCFKNNMPVGIFSLEMSADQLVHRIICSQSEVESDKIRTGNLNGIEFQRIVGAVSTMQQHLMVIDDQPGLKISDLRSRARRMKESYGIELLIVDYLQLISGSGSTRNQESRQNEISEISRMLKNLARELNVPVICLSQLSRRVEERPGHRPQMSDLRESGCLTGDTLIQNADTGIFYTIKELAEIPSLLPMNVLSLQEGHKIGKNRMIKAFYSGRKQVYELKTRSGRTIKASANHPFYKLQGWTPLEKLSVGDKIALPRHASKEKSTFISNERTKYELALLGHLIGDGCILPRQPYHYTSADMENIEIVSKAAKELFQIDARVIHQKNWFHAYLPSPYKVAPGVKHPITKWFNEIGQERVHSYQKQIPNFVFKQSYEDINYFLHHLWGTDGNISQKILKGRKPSASIYYATSSHRLAQQVQTLLVNVEIQSTLRTSPSSKGYRPMYHVVVQGTANQMAFLSNIGSSGKRGHIVPHLICQLAEIKENTNLDVIPKEVWHEYIRPAKEKLGMGWRNLCHSYGMSYCGTSLFKNGVSRTRLSQFADILKDGFLKSLSESDLYWDEIASITPLEVEDVYDATVEESHNFLANGIFVHNSIEQDADIVMFLLRREYYDPMDKPGLAEVIVGKNRHGAVGSVTMTYRKELAQFANFTPLRMDRVQGGAPDEAFSQFAPN